MSSDRDVITAMVAERIAQTVGARPREVMRVADAVMTLFDVHRAYVPGSEPGPWITLTLASVYPRDGLDAQRPSQGTGRGT